MAGEFRSAANALDPDEVSFVEVLDGMTMVGVSDVTYRFTVYTTNDIPRKTKVYITFPTNWKLDCANFPYQAPPMCLLGCAFTDVAIQCEAATNTLQLLQGFEGDDQYLYAPGPFIFDLKGMTNPPTTETQPLTMTTYNTDGTIYKIDESTNVFSLSFTTGLITVTSIVP